MHQYYSLLCDVLVLPQPDTCEPGAGTSLSRFADSVCVPSALLLSGDTEQSLVCEERVVNTVSKLCELSWCLNQGLYNVTFLCTVAFAFKGGSFKTVGIIHFRINWKRQKRGTPSVLAPRKTVSKAFPKLSRLQFSQAQIFRNAEFFQRPPREESFERRVLESPLGSRL